MIKWGDRPEYSGEIVKAAVYRGYKGHMGAVQVCLPGEFRQIYIYNPYIYGVYNI